MTVLTASYAESLHFAYLKRLPITSPGKKKNCLFKIKKNCDLYSATMVSHIEVLTQEWGLF